MQVLDWLQFTVTRQFFSHYFGNPPSWRVAIRSHSNRRTFPDFCLIGPIKAGTSDIATTLLLHPCVIQPLAKEIPSNEFHRLTAYYPTVREKISRRLQHGTALSPYLFPALHTMDCAYKLAKVCPPMKVIVALRNPIWRMYSHWKWEILLAGKQGIADMSFMHTFDAYVDMSLDLYPHTPMYTACGWEGLRTSIYWQAVKCWLDLFGAANVLVVESDDYFKGKTEFMYKIQEFLGLPKVAPPSLRDNVNENPLALPPPTEESIVKLKDFFRPHNDKLWETIGNRFTW